MEVLRLHEGDYFGEIALLNDVPRQATVKAVGDVSVISLDKASFYRLCGPLMDLLKRNVEVYAKYEHEATAAEAALAKLSVEDKGESAIKLDEDDSYDPDDNTPPPPSKAPAKRKHRTSVFVAPINPHEAFTPKVIPKDATQTTQLETTLKRTVLFGHLSPEDQSVVINAMEHKRVTAGTNIILQGADGDYFYVLESGRASAFVKGVDGRVAEYGPGGCFGELALMHGDPRAATVTADSDCELWALDRDTFRRIVMLAAFNKQAQHEKFLAKVPILSTLSKYERFRLADALQSQSFKDGETIIKEGDAGDVFYIVEKGEVVCSKR